MQYVAEAQRDFEYTEWAQSGTLFYYCTHAVASISPNLESKSGASFSSSFSLKSPLFGLFVKSVDCPVMLILGLGLGLKAKFCGLCLGLGLRNLALAKRSRPPPKSRGTTKFTIVIHYMTFELLALYFDCQ